LQIGNIFDKITLIMLGQDIAILLKLSLQTERRVLSTQLAAEIFLSPSEVSKALHRCKQSGLLYWTDDEKRVNRSALEEFIVHGMRYVFPPVKGPLTRGVPTGAAVEPLKSCFPSDTEPPPVWPYATGTVRGFAFSPLYKKAPQAALLDSKLYELLALCDSIRGGRIRERTLAVEKLKEALRNGV
jgi:hypothetical protein